MSKCELKEGMELYAVPIAPYIGKEKAVLVSSVGRKWAKINISGVDRYFDKNTWLEKEGEYSRAWTLYESRNAYLEIKHFQEVYNEFTREWEYGKLPRDFKEMVLTMYEGWKILNERKSEGFDEP